MLQWLRSPDLRTVLELAYFCSGVVVAVASSFVMYQMYLAKETLKSLKQQVSLAAAALSVARDDIKIRSQREAVTLAAELCVKISEQIFPRVNKNLEPIKAKGIEIRRWSLTDSSFDDAKYIAQADVRKWLDALVAGGVVGQVIAILNDMEGFAIYFTRGAADEEVAYPVIGAVFCEWVEWFAPHLAAVRTKQFNVTSGPYQNIVELYKVWAARGKRKQLELEANKINLELSGLSVPEVKPIGAH
jgi:hypothetical protein